MKRQDVVVLVVAVLLGGAARVEVVEPGGHD